MSDSVIIDKAVFAYAKAYAKLWKVIQENPLKFPRNGISCGLIAEHYAKMYLEHMHQESSVRFGAANEKGWDIEVVTKNEGSIKYQVKSVSVFNKSRVTTELVRGFDKLIVLGLGDDFFPHQAYLFNDASIFWSKNKTKRLTLPDQQKPGSAIFKLSENIKDDFDDALMID